MKLLRVAVIVGLVGLFSGGVVIGEEDTAFDSPVVLENAMLSVTVSDLHGLFEGAGSVAANISPMMNGIMLKSMIGGQMLGDPQLAGIERDKGMALIVINPSNMFAIVECGSESAIYTNKIATMGMQSKEIDGVLVVAKTLEQVTTGIGYIGEVKSKLLSRRSPSLRVSFSPTGLIEKNKDTIESMLEDMTSAMQMGMQPSQTNATESLQGMEKILEGEMRVVLSIAKQIESAEVTLFPQNGNIELWKVFKPVSGSDLDKFCSAPAINSWNKKLQAGSLGDGAFKIELLMKNPKALSDFITVEADKLIAEMKLDPSIIKPSIELMQKYMTVYGGTASESIMLGGKSMMSADFLVEITDEDAALKMLRDAQSNFKSTGIMDLYDNMGMSMSMALTEDVREYKGVKIHNFDTKIDTSNMPQEQTQVYDSMNMTNMVGEVAIFDGVMAYALNGTKIEDLIDRQKNPDSDAPLLQARKTSSKGGSYYMDIDISKYMATVASLMPTNIPGMPDFTQMSGMLQGADKITKAGFNKNGMIVDSLYIPGTLITRVGQMGMMMAMQSKKETPKQ